MKKRTKALLPLLAAAALTYMVAPAKAGSEQKAPFIGRNIAHRGLHTEDGAVPENSLAAFRRAAAAGYGVELDARLTLDGEVVVFHDRELARMTGREGSVEDSTLAELRALRLGGTDERIPLLWEVLELIGGRVPIVLELKRGSRPRLLCEKTLRLLRAYTGDVCVESFDPLIVRWFRLNAPDIFRGQLTASYSRLKGTSFAPAAFALSRSLSNFVSRPQFIAHGIGRKSLLTRFAESLGAVKAAWTAHDPEAERDNDIVIFEYYKPGPRF